MERTHSGDRPALPREAVPLLAAYEAGVTAICRLADRFDQASWGAQTLCPEWRAFELAAHLRCVADDLHEYLDEAPVSRYARLMGTGAHPESLARKLARQNAAELAALADAPPDEHIAAFARRARAYAHRLGGVWDLPHHQYLDTVVTVGGMAGAACAEWHLHAFDLAAALGADYRPADPAAVLAGWLAGMPHLPLPVPHGRLASWHGRHSDPWHAVLAASGRGTSVAAASRDAGQPASLGAASPAAPSRSADRGRGDRAGSGPASARPRSRWTALPLLRRKG